MNMEEQILIIETKNLIGLSFIIDEYDDFCRDYRNLLVRNHNALNVIATIKSLIEGPKRFVDKRIKEFYNKYATQINSINNHVKFVEFMYNNFNDLGDPSGYSKQFHDYLVANRQDAYRVLDLLFRFDKIGIKLIEFSEAFDFTQEVYEMNVDFHKNRDILYVDNIKIVPAYSKETVKYTTSNSAYEIEVAPSSDRTEVYTPRVKVNTLLIDVDRLPSKITKENTYDEIMKLSKTIEPESQAIRNSVDFNLGLFDAEKAYHTLMNVSREIDGVTNKQELLDSLKKVREGIDILSKVSNEYDNRVVQKNDHISHALLDAEKSNQLTKRKMKGN